MKMKKMVMVPVMLFAFSVTLNSCTVHKKGTSHDNGKHKGWYKNPNNPHHPNSTNPGHAKNAQKSGSTGNGNSGKAKGNSGKNK